MQREKTMEQSHKQSQLI